jgi:hypothetical protein
MFVKGQSGNPGGRPKNSEASMLKKAMRRIEKKRGVNFYERFCEMALEDPSVMVALMKKIIPDLKQVEMEGNLVAEMGIIEVPPTVPVGAPVGGEETNI